MSQPGEAAILVDAHVHIYDCFKLDVLLDSALENFCNAADKLGLKSAFNGVLLLTETRRHNWFLDARERCLKNKPVVSSESGWELQTTPDSNTLLAKKCNSALRENNELYIIAGRQVITAEGLELLALATENSFNDGMPATVAIAAVRETGAIPVFPWAVGKWLGVRGKILSDLLSRDVDLFLGDNSGRPVFWRNPSHFREAARLDMRILPGSDPLPFESESRRVGSFGFAMTGTLSRTQPSSDLKRLLLAKTMQLQTYGRLESPIRFMANQLRLRLA